MLNRHSEQKIVLVVRETRIQKLKQRFNTSEQAKFFVERRGGNFTDYVNEDDRYQSSVGEAEAILQKSGNVQVIDRAFLPNFVFGPNDTIVAIGQDGLVANTLKYLLEGQPLIGVNPDPQRWDGVLLPFEVADLKGILPAVLAGKHSQQSVTMASAILNDGQRLLAVNDFFIGQRTHQSARYAIESDGQKERQSSSGVIVSTPLGSSGWMKSLLHGATSIANGICGVELDVPENVRSIPWCNRTLYFTVREPFPSRSTQASLVFGEITCDRPLTIRSQMPENGVIFSDGIEQDFIEFNAGASVRISLADVSGNLVA